MNLLFTINFKQFIKDDLPGIRRKPKWIATLYSLYKPFEMFYNSFLGERQQNLRRKLCNGSVISLEKLLFLELNIKTDIVDNDNSGRRTGLVSTEAEKATAFIGTDVDVALFFVTDMETENSQAIDYIVLINTVIAENIRDEVIERIRSLLNIYNSAGFTFKIKYEL